MTSKSLIFILIAVNVYGKASNDILDLGVNLMKDSYQIEANSKDFNIRKRLIRNAFKVSNFTFLSQIKNTDSQYSKQDFNFNSIYNQNQKTLESSISYVPTSKSTPLLNGLESTFEHSLSKSIDNTSTQFQNLGLPKDEYSSDFNFKVQYNLINNGKNARSFISNKSFELINEAESSNILSEINSNFITITNLIIRYQLQRCQIIASKISISQLSKIIKTMNIKYKANQIEKQQVLNLTTLKEGLEVSVLENQNNALALKNNILQLTKGGFELSDKNCKEMMTDKYLISSLKKTNQALSQDFAFKKLPESIVLKKEYDIKKQNIISKKQSLKPDINIYIKKSSINERISSIRTNNNEIGVELNWIIPEKRNYQELAQAKVNKYIALQNYLLAKNTFKNKVSYLRNQVQLITKQVQRIKKNIEINTKLLKILEIKKGIGQLDSLSIYNAFSQLNQSRLNFIEKISDLMMIRLTALTMAKPKLIPSKVLEKI